MKDRRPLGGYTRVEAVVALVAIAAGVGIALPLRLDARAERAVELCRENLLRIDAAKGRYIVARNVGPADPIDLTNLSGIEGVEILKSPPIGPRGGAYRTEVMAADPTCSTGLPGHDLYIYWCSPAPELSRTRKVRRAIEGFVSAIR